MKVHPDCIPCLMKRVVFQSRLLENGREFESATAALKAYGDNISRDSNSAKLATVVHEASYAALGVKDPYSKLKVEADDVAERYMGRSKEFVEGSADRFRAAVKVSIMGNIMDFGSGIAIDDPEEFSRLFEVLLGQDIGCDDTDDLKDIVEKGRTVIYIFDNCGESQFDKLLIREIRGLGKRVIGVVRGEPILNDVTLEDAIRIGLDKELDVLLTTNAFAIGIDMEKVGKDLRTEMREASVVIAKGMANYESLSDEILDIPVFYLLKAKCMPVATSLGVGLGTNVVRRAR